MTFDRRRVPVNDRVVAQHLAEAFPDRTPVAPEPARIVRPVADILNAPGGARDRQALLGQRFDVLERRDGHAFGWAPASSYVGWVAEAALAGGASEQGTASLIRARQSHAYARPDFKSPEQLALPHGAVVHVRAYEGRFAETSHGWIPQAHLAPDMGDPVDTALIYLGTPYLWGGNSCWGIDCSGLVSAAFSGRGVPVPGDSDQQLAELGQALPADAPVQRGDLFFWKGHVGLIEDADTLLHANAHHMAVVREPLQAAIARIADQGDGPVIGRRRVTLPA